jgi:putative membrane protein insertion efficiency factor
VPCSRAVGPRAAPACRLDPSGPRSPVIPTLIASWHADPSCVPLVHMVSESRSDRHGRGVRSRSRARSCGHTQSPSPPTPSDLARTRPHRTAPAVSAADRGDTTHTRTDVRSIAERTDIDGRSDPFASSPAAGRWQRVMLRTINWYQHAAAGRLSPCRFYPSCSEYGRESIEVHGARRGLWLTVRRLLRCRPFGPSGYDPVPLPSSPPRSRS